MSSLENLHWTTQILPLWTVLACGTITSCTMTWDQKTCEQEAKPKRELGSVQLSEQHRNEAQFSNLLHSGAWGPAQLHPVPLFKHWAGEHSGSGSTQPGVNHYVSKPKKTVKSVALAYGAKPLNVLSNLHAEWPAPYMEAQYIPHALYCANGNSPK